MCRSVPRQNALLQLSNHYLIQSTELKALFYFIGKTAYGALLN
nr:MAG TPA: hypothetical protein [Caudoviricetes sp.]